MASWRPAGHGERQDEVGAGRGVLRPLLDGLQQVRNGLVHSSFSSEHAAEPRVRLREVGIQGQGLPELDDRVVRLAAGPGPTPGCCAHPGSPGSSRSRCGTARSPPRRVPPRRARTRSRCGPPRRPGSTPRPASGAAAPPRFDRPRAHPRRDRRGGSTRRPARRSSSSPSGGMFTNSGMFTARLAAVAFSIRIGRAVVAVLVDVRQEHLRVGRAALGGEDQPAAVGREAVPGVHQRRVAAHPARLRRPSAGTM